MARRLVSCGWDAGELTGFVVMIEVSFIACEVKGRVGICRVFLERESVFRWVSLRDWWGDWRPAWVRRREYSLS